MTRAINAIRVIIADHQPAFRATLKTVLALEEDVTTVGEAADADGVVELLESQKPDVLLIEAALFCSLRCHPRSPVDVMTLVTIATLDRDHVLKAFLEGARAIVPKPSASNVWPESIRAVVSGRYWLGNESIEILVQALREHLPKRAAVPYPNNRLTPREVEIIDKIATGHSNREVGEAFSIRERTVKHHLSNIFIKVGVSSRLELALYALNHRLTKGDLYQKNATSA